MDVGMAPSAKRSLVLIRHIGGYNLNGLASLALRSSLMGGGKSATRDEVSRRSPDNCFESVMGSILDWCRSALQNARNLHAEPSSSFKTLEVIQNHTSKT